MAVAFRYRGAHQNRHKYSGKTYQKRILIKIDGIHG